MWTRKKQSVTLRTGRYDNDPDIDMVVASSAALQYSCNPSRKMKSRVWYLSTSLFLLSIVTCALLVTLLLYVFVLILRDDVCVTKECVESAASLIKSMDLSRDPCEDFYSFACEGFVNENPVPDDDVTIDHFREEENSVSHQLRVILEMPPSENDSEAVKKTRAFYQTCMNTSKVTTNTTKIDEMGLAPLLAFLDELGGWPIVAGRNWIPDNETTLEDLFAKVERMGFHMELVSVGMAPDIRDPYVYRLTLDQPDDSELRTKTGRRRRRDLTDALRNATEMRARTILIKSLVKLLGNDDNATIDKDIAGMLLLENDLEERFTPRHERRNFTRMYNKMTVDQLYKLTNGSVDWLRVFQKIFEGVTNITGDEEIVVAEVDFLRRLAEVTALHDRRTITNYVVWTAVDYLTDHLNSDVLELLFRYNRKVNNVTESKTRWEMCLGSTMDFMGFAVGRIFVGQRMDTEDKESAEDFIRSLRQTYARMINTSDWLDDATKRTALRKIQNMRQFVGYPEWIRDDDELDRFYDYVIVSDNHFTNIIHNQRNATEKNLANYRKPVDKERWTDIPTTVNAYYEQHSNSIWFPAGILRPPFYSTNYLKAINFGSIGAIIGHEIGHAFDNEGSQLDEMGYLREWWSDKSAREYKKRTACYVTQYDQYCQGNKEDDETCVDGINTLGENIADNTGIRCAFETYRRWVENHRPEKKLPGLQQFSPEQIFFVSFAQTWCENFRPDQWQNIYSEDPHSPGRFRVQGALSNFPAFARIFGCQRGPMNREEEGCLLW